MSYCQLLDHANYLHSRLAFLVAVAGKRIFAPDELKRIEEIAADLRQAKIDLQPDEVALY